MVKFDAEHVLNDANATVEEIEQAIARLQADIDYVKHAHPFANKGLRDSVQEYRHLIRELETKLSNQNK